MSSKCAPCVVLPPASQGVSRLGVDDDDARGVVIAMDSGRPVAALCAGTVAIALGLQVLTHPAQAAVAPTAGVSAAPSQSSAGAAPPAADIAQAEMSAPPGSSRELVGTASTSPATTLVSSPDYPSHSALVDGDVGASAVVDGQGRATVAVVQSRQDPQCRYPTTSWEIKVWSAVGVNEAWTDSPDVLAQQSCGWVPSIYLSVHDSGAVAIVARQTLPLASESPISAVTMWLWDPDAQVWSAPVTVVEQTLGGVEQVVMANSGTAYVMWNDFTCRGRATIDLDCELKSRSISAVRSQGVVSQATEPGSDATLPRPLRLTSDSAGNAIVYHAVGRPGVTAYCRTECVHILRAEYSPGSLVYPRGSIIATTLGGLPSNFKVDELGNAMWEDFIPGEGLRLRSFVGGKLFEPVKDLPIFLDIDSWDFRGSTLYVLARPDFGREASTKPIIRHHIDLSSGRTVNKVTVGTVAGSESGNCLRGLNTGRGVWVDRAGAPMSLWRMDGCFQAPSQDVMLQSGDEKAESIPCMGICLVGIGHGGQGVLLDQTNSLVGSTWIYELRVTRFGVPSSCVVVPRDGGVLSLGTAEVSPSAASVGVASSGSVARKRFGPVEIAGCLFQDKQGRWVHQGDAVRMNGVDIEADPGTVRFDPRQGEVAFVPCDRKGPVMCAGSGASRRYAIKAGTYSVYSWSMTGDSMVRAPWRSKDSEVRFDPIAMLRTVTRGVVEPPRQLGPAGLEVADRLGLSLTLTYDQVERQGKATLEFAVEVPLPVGVHAVPAKVRVPEKLAEAEKAVSVPEVRGVEQAPAPPPPPPPTAPARQPNGECSPAEDGAVIVINGSQYVCGIGMDRADQRHRWRAKTPANTPGRAPVAGQFCNAAKDAGRTPVRTGKRAVECARGARPNRAGQYEYRWKTARVPAVVKEGQACKIGDVGRSYPARKPALRRSGAPETGQLVCMQVSTTGKVRQALVWQPRTGVFVSLTFQTTTEKGLLPVTVAATLKRLDVGPVALADVSLRLRPPSATTPAELGFTGTIEATAPIPGVKLGRRLGSVSAEIAWADTDLSKFRLAATGTLPLGSITILGAEFEAQRDDSATPWQLSVGGRIGFGPAIPPNIAAGDEEWKFLFEGAGRLTYRSEPKDLTRRIIFTGQGTWWGMPVGSMRLEMHSAESNPWKPTRYEIEVLLGIDPGQWIGLPGIVTAQGKLYGWYDPTKELFQLQGYAGLRVPLAATDFTGNLLVSSRGKALCYSTGGEFAGWVYLYKDGESQDFDTGCDVGTAAIA